MNYSQKPPFKVEEFKAVAADEELSHKEKGKNISAKGHILYISFIVKIVADTDFFSCGSDALVSGIIFIFLTLFLSMPPCITGNPSCVLGAVWDRTFEWI